MVIGFFMQFTAPPPKRPAKRKSVSAVKRRKVAVPKAKKPTPKKAKAKKPKQYKPAKLSPEQEVQLGLYFAKRDGLKFDFSNSNIPS